MLSIPGPSRQTTLHAPPNACYAYPPYVTPQSQDSHNANARTSPEQHFAVHHDSLFAVAAGLEFHIAAMNVWQGHVRHPHIYHGSNEVPLSHSLCPHCHMCSTDVHRRKSTYQIDYGSPVIRYTRASCTGFKPTWEKANTPGVPNPTAWGLHDSAPSAPVNTHAYAHAHVQCQHKLFLALRYWRVSLQLVHRPHLPFDICHCSLATGRAFASLATKPHALLVAGHIGSCTPRRYVHQRVICSSDVPC